MTRSGKVALIMSLILLASAMGAQNMEVRSDNQASDKVEIILVKPEASSRVPKSLIDVSLPPGSFILVNRTSVPITAIVVLWTYLDSSGRQRQRRMNYDAYVLAPVDPIVGAQGEALITPYGCTRQEYFANLSSNGVLGSLAKPDVGLPLTPDPSVPMHVKVDSVFFEDGGVLGSDKLDYSTEIRARYTAVTNFVEEVIAAKEHGESTTTTLDRIRRSAEAVKGKEARRRAYYAGLLQRSPNPQVTLEQLMSQPKVPEFHRIGDF